MSDAEYVKSRAEKAARKELKRHQNLVDKYLNKEAGAKVNTRLARTNLDESLRLFALVKSEVNKAIDSLEDSTEFVDTEIAVIEARWENELYEFDTWSDEKTQALEAEERAEAKAVKKANAKETETALKRDYTTLHTTITNSIASLKSSLPATVSPAMFDVLKTRYNDIQKSIDVDLTTIAQSRARIDSAESEAIMIKFDEDKIKLKKDFDDMVSTIMASLPAPLATSSAHNSVIIDNPETETSSMSTISQRSKGDLYTKRKLPEFNGDVRHFPRWIKEWEEDILPKYNENAFLTLIDENTPDYISLLNCTSPKEALDKLKNKFANPNIV